MRRYQLIWKWRKAHCPEGEAIRWHFSAHGARYEKASADEMAALLRSHGKIVRYLAV